MAFKVMPFDFLGDQKVISKLWREPISSSIFKESTSFDFSMMVL